MCVWVLKGERGVFWGKGCGGVVERAKEKERDEEMREKVDEISNERVWRGCEVMERDGG